MPMQSFLRSKTTGEILDPDTLKNAAFDHGIKISETSVGSMFHLSDRTEAVKKTASVLKKAKDTLDEGKGRPTKQSSKKLSFAQRRRAKLERVAFGFDGVKPSYDELKPKFKEHLEEEDISQSEWDKLDYSSAEREYLFYKAKGEKP